ncbi:COP9 signalosome complex subunit 1 [Pleurostoma richardsiae]|uniref:COP9 signalosome complex subunit 1 n=1 Tax=Pleurostoma richardsiae TaxID=41990 RepID=A0AA38RMF1_9PEZI|nr:COP9 signalosome complex subunit 1 [Pleurostoma richardsiae]
MAAPTGDLLNFFSLMDAQDGVIVQETPKLDLELYIQNYKGRTRFDRLLLIGRSSVVLCVDALKVAIAEAKKGKDVHRYREAWECIRVAAPGEPEAQFDWTWVDTTEKSNKAETHRLESELKGYKNNLVKESIRMGNEDLGRHLEATGDLNGATEAYSRMRPDVSTAKQIVDVGRHLVSVSVQRREWAMVTANLNKMASLQNADEEKAIQPYLNVMHGIALLGQEKYVEAANSFLQADSQAPPSLYNEFVSHNDVAAYGGLLALATMDRKELQAKVLDNQNFRTFLELEPHIRRAITQFVSGRYSACLTSLESYRADYLLDIYLQKHIKTIYAQIRSKCIVQYLVPFSRVGMESMKAAFEVQGYSLEEELVSMIREGVLQARIDSIDQQKVITTVSVNPRAKMQATALEAARSFEKEALDRIRRMGIAAAELEVKGSKKGGSGNVPLPQNAEGSWIDVTRHHPQLPAEL